MKNWIKEKLEKIEKMFPVERLEASKARWRAIWDGKKPADRLPYICAPRHLNYYNDYNAVNETDLRLEKLLDECILHGRLRDDFIPSLFPGCKQSTIPNMFGAKEICVGNDFTCQKLIHNIEEIDSLPDFSMRPGTVAHEWIARQGHWKEQTDGRLPIHVTDMQGPVDVCGQLMGYEKMFIESFEKPQKIHNLLSIVSKAFIAFWNEQQNLLGDLFVGTHLFGYSWLPTGVGATLSADSIVMVSSEYYDKFYDPLLCQISESFNGIIIHSCGNFSHLLNNLQRLPKLRGINASQMSLRELQQAGLKPKTVAIFVSRYEDAFQQIDLIKKTGQMAEMTVYLYPKVLEEEKSPQEWNTMDWENIFQREEKLLEALRLS